MQWHASSFQSQKHTQQTHNSICNLTQSHSLSLNLICSLCFALLCFACLAPLRRWLPFDFSQQPVSKPLRRWLPFYFSQQHVSTALWQTKACQHAACGAWNPWKRQRLQETLTRRVTKSHTQPASYGSRQSSAELRLWSFDLSKSTIRPRRSPRDPLPP